MNPMRAAAIYRSPNPPRCLTRLQIKRELERRNLWATVKAIIESDPVSSEEWELAVEIRINDPLFIAIADVLGMDTAAIDNFARSAAAETT